MLTIQNLSVEKGGKRILNNLNAFFDKGKTYLLIGPNGSGKSTLAQTIMGDSSSKISKGTINFEDTIINTIPANQRTEMGIYVSWQIPPTVEGISTKQLLRIAKNELSKKQKRKPPSLKEFNELLNQACQEISIPSNLLNSALDNNLSGGERKALELLHTLILDPQLIVLDEIDSGLDADRKSNLIKVIKLLQQQNKTIIIISHNHTLYNSLNIADVYLMKKGKIIMSNQQALAQVNQNGYRNI